MINFQRIDPKDNQWDQRLHPFFDRTVFQTAPWVSFIAKTQKAEPVVAALTSGKEALGYFIGLLTRKFNVRILGSPFPGWTTSYMGFCLRPEVSRRDALKALIPFAFRDLRCVHLEIMDRQLTVEDADGLGFAHRILKGFEVDLTPSEEQIFANLSKSCRWTVRKAEKNGVTVEEAHDIHFADDYYAQLQDVFAKQSLTPPYTIARVRELINEVLPSGKLLLLRARDPDGNCIATGLFPALNQTMFFWGGASWREHQRLFPNEAIQWYAIKYWKQRGIKAYDMNGKGEYKRKYGGAEIVVPWFRLSKYSALSHLRNLSHQLFRARQSILGKWYSFSSPH